MGTDSCIVRRDDGVFVDPGVPGDEFRAALDRVFSGHDYFTGLNYPALLGVAYDCGVEPRPPRGGPLVRFAAAVTPFAPERRELYRAVKIADGKAEYYFEPVYLPGADGAEAMLPARLDVDEFVADMWVKGVRFGVDIDAVRSAIASNKADRVTVARQLDAVPGEDARVIEVSGDLHRSDAPRQLANGKLDLMAFQNRFPQIKEAARLLKKIPRAAGSPGFDLSGKLLEAAIPADVDLNTMAGAGTKVEVTAEGEFLVALRAGFLNVDSGTSQVSVGDKIVSRDGVSARTTGNLQLKGDYEEFGEVQEKRVIEGESITVHADVFGKIVSRGGSVLLNSNLVGGSAHNACGDIQVKGVASAAVIQASQGAVILARAESCVISGTRVFIEHAVNCEIIGEDVVVARAEGCAIAGRRVDIEAAGARRQSEMLVFVLQPDCTRIDEVIGQIGARVEEFSQLVERRKAESEAMKELPGVRQYMVLATKVRKGEVRLTPEQAQQLQKMGAAVAPALKSIGKVAEDIKAAETEQQAGAALLAQLRAQRAASAGVNRVSIKMLTGDAIVRTIPFHPDRGSTYDLPPREIRAQLRASAPGGERIFAGSVGSVDWESGQPS